MSIVLKDAEKLWKKVKPLTLTKTGVSESLAVLKNYDRKLIDENTAPDWAKKFATLASKMDKHVKDDHIKKHSKAHKWLNELDAEIAKEGQFISKFREHQAKVKEEERVKAEQEKKRVEQEEAKKLEERKIAQQNREWADGLEKALQKLTKLDQDLEESLKEAKRIVKQVRDGSYPAFSSMLVPDEIAFLENAASDYPEKRQQQEKLWSPIAKSASASKTAPASLGKTADELKSLDGKLQNGEKTLAELIKQARKGEEEWHKESNTELGKIRLAFKNAEQVLTDLDKQIDSLMQAIDHDTKDLKAGKLTQNHDYNYQSFLEDYIKARQELKPSWFNNQEKSRELAQNDKDLLKIMDNVVKLDAGLRAGGKEGAAKKKLDGLFEARKEYSEGKGSKTGPKTSPQTEPKSQGTNPPPRSGKKTPTSKDFQTLGLKWPCTLEAVKSAYKPLALKWHPDKWAGKSEQEQNDATEKFKEIANAYQAITAYLE